MPVTITLQALSLEGKADLVQLHFKLRLRDWWSMWMQDGCKVNMDSYMTSNRSCFLATGTIYQKAPLGGRPNTKPGDHGTPNHWFILFYHVWIHAWIETHWNSIWLSTSSRYDFTLHLRFHDHTTWFWRCVGMAFGHFPKDSHSFMVTALGSFMKCL